MIQRLWIPGPLPGANELIAEAKGAGGTGAEYSRLKRSWTDTVCMVARAARLRPLERAWFAFQWREKNRRRDPDNIAGGGRKLVFDGLILAKILAGDGWRVVIGWEDTFEVTDKPGVMVALLDAAPVKVNHVP